MFKAIYLKNFGMCKQWYHFRYYYNWLHFTDKYYVFQDAKCCLFPPFFVREIARECGAIFALKYRNFDHNITTFRREAMTVGTPKEEAKSLAMFIKSVYDKATRGIKNRTHSEKGVININTYRVITNRSKKKKKKHTRKRRHKSIEKHPKPINLTSPQNQTSLQSHTLSQNHQTSLNHNKSSHSKYSVRFYLSILSLIN